MGVGGGQLGPTGTRGITDVPSASIGMGLGAGEGAGREKDIVRGQH